MWLYYLVLIKMKLEKFQILCLGLRVDETGNIIEYLYEYDGDACGVNHWN